MELKGLHTATYNALADQYEARVDLRRAPTRAVVDLLVGRMGSGRVLDVGCGVGLLVEMLQARGLDAIGIDIADRMVSYARSRTSHNSIVSGDFRELKPTVPFDAITMLAFIHLFPREDAVALLHHAHNILTPGGLLYVGSSKSDTTSEGLRKKQGYSGLSRRFRATYTEPDFIRLLKDGRFEVPTIHYIEDLEGRIWMDAIALPS